MDDLRKLQDRQSSMGFTIVELIIVMVIIGIAAMIAIPTLSSAADVQARAAGNRLAADLDYAKGLAITHQKTYAVVFYPNTESYDIRQVDTDTIVKNPVVPNRDYVINFTTDRNLNRVKIDSANFDAVASNAVTFDYLGSPYSGIGTATPLTSGRITLKADNFTLYVDIEPVTGYVTLSGL
jgi:prepilin-type N-terminal cleavage/methylation domain-containing protein